MGSSMQGDMHMVAARLGCQSAMGGQGEVGGVIRRVTCTWWLPWLGPGGPIPALAAWTGLENANLTL